MTNMEKYLVDILAELRSCRKEIMNWLKAEVSDESEGNWSKVPVDTPIWVRDDKDDEWEPQHFAKYEGGFIHTWYDGMTSWTANGYTVGWKYAKLAKEASNGKD